MLGTAMRARPVVSVLVLQIILAALTVGGALLLGVLVPSLPGYSTTEVSQSLVLVLVLAALALVLVAVLRWWRPVGYTPASQWRDLRLYWLPVLLLAAPLVAGVRLPEAGGTVAMLLVAYSATAVFEETIWRGVMLHVLRPLGVWPAVLGSSVLFGLGHLSNSALRGFSALILLQAFGAAVQGIGLAALRLRTNTIWPLIAIHALHDIGLQLGYLPIAAIEAPVATIIAVYGIYLLRGGRAEPAPGSVGRW